MSLEFSVRALEYLTSHGWFWPPLLVALFTTFRAYVAVEEAERATCVRRAFVSQRGSILPDRDAG